VVAVARRLLRQFAGDRRTLGMIFGAPVLVLGLLSLVFDSEEYRPKIAVVDAPPPAVAELEAGGARAVALDAVEADARLRRGELDAVVRFGPTGPAVLVEGSDPAVTRAVMLALQRTVSRRERQAEVSYLHGSPSMSSFDNFGPVLVGFLVFFFVFLVSGIAFVRERTTGTLDRMLATPIRRWEVVLGYAAAFATLVVVQSTIIATASVYLFGLMLVGSFAWLLVITTLLAISAMTIGMLLSAFARSEFQLIQFIPVVIVPQIFFSGLFQLETMHPALVALGRVLPLTYGAHAMREIMIRGGGASALAVDLAVLSIFPAVCLAANVVALKRVRAL
jgi:ABC-2 type transport system permease protein